MEVVGVGAGAAPAAWERGPQRNLIVGGSGHYLGMFILAGLSIGWLLIVAVVALGFVVWGAAVFLTPTAPQSFRIVSAFIIANLVVGAVTLLVGSG